MFEKLKKLINKTKEEDKKIVKKVKEDETDVALGDLLHNLNTEMRKTGVNSKVIREVNGKQIEEDTDEYFKNKKK